MTREYNEAGKLLCEAVGAALTDEGTLQGRLAHALHGNVGSLYRGLTRPKPLPDELQVRFDHLWEACTGIEGSLESLKVTVARMTVDEAKKWLDELLVLYMIVAEGLWVTDSTLREWEESRKQ